MRRKISKNCISILFKFIAINLKSAYFIFISERFPVTCQVVKLGFWATIAAQLPQSVFTNNILNIRAGPFDHNNMMQSQITFFAPLLLLISYRWNISLNIFKNRNHLLSLENFVYSHLQVLLHTLISNSDILKWIPIILKVVSKIWYFYNNFSCIMNKIIFRFMDRIRCC